MVQHHFLMLTYPAQGHVNPALGLAHRLINMGAMVTVSTTLHMHRRIQNTLTTIPTGLSFASFSDGHDDHHPKLDDQVNADRISSIHHYFSDLQRRGMEFVTNLIASDDVSHPFTCILHTMLFPWATQLARKFHLPSALLWVQPASLFAIFHYYFKDDNLIKNKLDESIIIELPGLPPLKHSELPSFITSPSDVYSFILPSLGEDLRIIQQEHNPIVLVNTFDELESEALRVVHDCFKTIAVGPLVPSNLLEEENKQALDSPNDCMEWLSSKAESSVIYISFGSLSVYSKRQMEEIARGLIESGRPFLWSIREEKEQEKVEELREEMQKLGKIVKWCDQVEILSHKSVGCFVSHCGWNSILESMVAGVPVVGIPQWSDQPTNAKLIDEVWKIGVRATAVENSEGIVRGEDIRRCIEEVIENGEKGKEVGKNVLKWREVSREAVKVGGSSDANLRAFLDQLN